MTNKRLRVDRVGPKTTEKRLRRAFETIGKVDKIEMPVDVANGARALTAFVTFLTNRDATRAISVLNGTNLDDHEIIVSWAGAGETPRREG